MAPRLMPEERSVLEDQLRREEESVQRCRRYADRSTDPLVRSVFASLARDARDHCDTLGRLLGDKEGRGWQRPGLPAEQDTDGAGVWQSTAKRLLFGQNERNWETGRPFQASRLERGPHWGGMMPGDAADVNHGDLTRGGLGGRGVK